MVIGENIYKWPLSIANCQYTAHFPTDLCPFSLGKDALKTRWRWDPIGDPCRRSASSGDISRCSAALGTYHTSTSGLVVFNHLETSQQVDWNRFFPNLSVIIIPKKIQERILVGGIPTPLKNMKVSWDDYSQSIYGKTKKGWKQPTRYDKITTISWIYKKERLTYGSKC